MYYSTTVLYYWHYYGRPIYMEYIHESSTPLSCTWVNRQSSYARYTDRYTGLILTL